MKAKQIKTVSRCMAILLLSRDVKYIPKKNPSRTSITAPVVMTLLLRLSARNSGEYMTFVELIVLRCHDTYQAFGDRHLRCKPESSRTNFIIRTNEGSPKRTPRIYSQRRSGTVPLKVASTVASPVAGTVSDMSLQIRLQLFL